VIDIVSITMPLLSVKDPLQLLLSTRAAIQTRVEKPVQAVCRERVELLIDAYGR